MEKNQEEIIAKIQKLLNLAERAGSDEEAQSAAMSARRLLTKYNLTMSEVKAFKEEECQETSIIIKKRYFPSYTRILANAVTQLFSCQFFMIPCAEKNPNRQKITFVGINVDAELACQTYTFLSQYMNRKTRELGLIGKRETDYKYGFAVTVSIRCGEMSQELKNIPEERALVPLKDATINNYLSRVHPELVSARSITKRTYSAEMLKGMDDGNKVNLGRPIEGSSVKAALPL